MAVPSNQLSAVPKPEPSYPCQWKEGTFTSAELFNQELPIVAMAKKTMTADGTVCFSNFKTMQPLLLYSSTVTTKVEARSIVLSEQSATYTEVGDRLVIPEDYAGWFMRNQTEEAIAASSFSSIDAIAQTTDVEEFLIGGKTTLLAFHERYNEATSQREELVEYLAPGDILKRGHAVSRKRTTFLRSSQESYLTCTNISGREYVIPRSSTGSFYPVLTSGKRTLFQMSHLVKERAHIPCNVHLVYGRGPATPCIFNDNLRLLSRIEEKSIVASTIFNKINILVEINVNMPMNFAVADKTPELIDGASYQNALTLCQRKGRSFSRGIKILSTWHTTQTDNVGYGYSGQPGACGNEAVDNDRRSEENRGIPIGITRTQSIATSRHSVISTSSLDSAKSDTQATGSISTVEQRSLRVSGRSGSFGSDNRSRTRSVRRMLSNLFGSRVRLALSSSVPIQYPNCAVEDYRCHSNSEDEQINSEPEKNHEKTPPVDIVNGPFTHTKKLERDNSVEIPIPFGLPYNSQTNHYENIAEQNLPESEFATQHACGYASACANVGNNSSYHSDDGYDYLPCMQDSGDHYETMTPPQHFEKGINATMTPKQNLEKGINVNREKKDRNSSSSDSDGEHIYDTPDVNGHYPHEEDDLPVGSSCTLLGYGLWHNRDSGYTGSSDPLSLTSLSVTEVSDALRARLISESTIEALQRAGVDGILLLNMDAATLREAAPGITGLEVIKITLYLKKGWNLNK